MKSFYDKLEITKYSYSNSKNNRFERKKYRRKFKQILKTKDYDSAVYYKKNYFRRPKGQYHIGPWNKMIKSFLEKNVNKPWDEVYHELKEIVKHSQGKFNISLDSLLNGLTNYSSIFSKRTYKPGHFYIVNRILIKHE